MEIYPESENRSMLLPSNKISFHPNDHHRRRTAHPHPQLEHAAIIITMSSTKRSRQRPAETHAASALPASKRLKSSHLPAPSPSQPAGSGLGFLVDENARAGRKLNAKLTNGVAPTKSTRVDDSHAAVMPANADTSDSGDYDTDEEAAPAAVNHEIISVSSDAESSDGESEEEGNVTSARPLTNGHSTASRSQQALVRTEDTEMADADVAEASFGDLLQARHPDPIDVQKALQTTDPNDRSLATAGAQSRGPVTPASLGVVLAQALKTKDKDLLEDCFRLNDTSSIRATIQRQQSHQVATLLELIAERIHKRPGRTGKLMTWVQWSLVSHGGYLANQPELMRKLKSLGTVVRERANGLQPLLHLKGKLDLLSAQLELRRNMQAASRAANADDLDDDAGVLYIEGQGQDWSDSDEEDDDGHPAKRRTERSLQIKDADDESSEDDTTDEEFAQKAGGAVNGLEYETSEDDTTDEEDGAGMLDIEAEESDDEDDTTNDEADTDAPSDDDEDDDSEDDESDEVAVKQPKHSTLNRKR